MHVDNKVTIDVLQKKERKSVSSQEQEIQTCGSKSGEELHELEKGILVEVEHVKAHRTMKEKK